MGQEARLTGASRLIAGVALLALFGVVARARAETVARPGAEPFALRGYYITLMRMPVMGLAEWKQAVDCFADDDVNVLILWTAGGFRSQKYPITWQYNAEHANVRKDFVRELIDYAHTKNIRVLVGFTPFGYDGVNRFTIEHPELKAHKADGTAVDEFGIHSHGWNLCPAQVESQRFMREYIGEMVFDFYPNADGVLVESSDYGVCHCPKCGPHYYDHEFEFVRWLSDEVWRRKPEATIVVFPHYFNGRKVPGLEATAARQPFDPRWSLVFTPHSSHFDADLIGRAKESIYWTDATVLGTPRGIADAARTARENRVTGFIPSLEAFSYIPPVAEGGEPWVAGERQRPFGFDPAAEGKMPYNTLPVRVQRYAFRAFSHDPALEYVKFELQLGEHFFGANAPATAAADLLELQRIWTRDCNWYWQSPLLDPAFFRAHAARLNWGREKLAEYNNDLGALREIASRNADAANATQREMAALAMTIVRRWDAAKATPSTTGRREAP